MADGATRTPLSRERVLREALALADAEGIDALSMRKLARRLGVEAMSLYNHVENKDDLLDGMLELVGEEIELPDDAPDWKTALQRNAVSTRDTFLRHRWASGLSMSRQSTGPNQIRRADWMLRTLREAGLSEDLTYHAFHILESHILGFTFQQLNFEYTGDALKDVVTEFLEELPTADYPDFAAHAHQHLEPHDETGFELGLGLVLDGLERLRDARHREE